MLQEKYTLLRLLGEGGMGSVYEAEHKATGQRVAVKIMQRHLLAHGSQAVQRFRREARAASATQSRYVVQVLDSATDESQGVLYLVMEYLEGGDLQQVIHGSGPLKPDLVLRIAAQALLGLQKAHEARIVHRDIKPSNLFLARGADGEITVKLLDFGVAKIKAEPLLSQSSEGLTSTNGLLGSPLYMSPEQALSSREIDHRSDLWSLASTLYCALSGRAPHQQAGTLGRLIFAVCSAPPPSLLDVAPSVPPAVAKVIHGALKLEPAERYPSAEAMLDALRPLLPDGFAISGAMLPQLGPRQSRALSREESARTQPTPGLEGELISGRARATERGSLGGATLEPLSTDADSATGASREAARAWAEGRREAAWNKPLSREEPLHGHSEAFRATEEGGAARETQAAREDGGSGGQVQRPERVSPPASRRRAKALVGAGLMALAAGTGAVAFHGAYERDVPERSASAAAAPRHEPLPSSSPAPVSAAPPEIRRVRLAVPDNASVEVDRVQAKVSNGAVEIAGALGSVHIVRVARGKSEIEANVFVTEMGAEPVKIELPAPRITTPPRNAAPVRAAAMPAAPAATTSKPSTPRDDVLLRTAE